MKTKRRRGTGLVLKFSLLMIVLVMLIVAGVAVPLMLQMRTREQRTLAEGLQKRAKILLESVALRAAEPIRAGGLRIPVSRLPGRNQRHAGRGALTDNFGARDINRPGAPAAEDPLDRDYLWATNDDR